MAFSRDRRYVSASAGDFEPTVEEWLIEEEVLDDVNSDDSDLDPEYHPLVTDIESDDHSTSSCSESDADISVSVTSPYCWNIYK